MTTAERLYQEEKNKYAFEVRPRKTRARTNAGLNANDRKRILQLIAIVAVICIGIMVAIAYGAYVNYQNNQLQEKNDALSGEVDSLKVELQSANNVAAIEHKASKELGMVYPSGKKYVVVKSTAAKSNFASLLKQRAFD